MAKVAQLGKRESVLFIPIGCGDFLGARGTARNGIAIAEPTREIAVFTTLRTEGCELFGPSLFADRAGFGCGHIVGSGATRALHPSTRSLPGYNPGGRVEGGGPGRD